MDSWWHFLWGLFGGLANLLVDLRANMSNFDEK